MSNALSYGLAFFAVFCYSALTVMAKKMVVSVPPLVFISLTMLILFILASGAALIRHGSFSLSVITPQQWWWLVGYGVLNFTGFVAYLIAIGGIPANHYQLMFAISPLFVAALSFLILGESINLRFFIGFTLVASGLWVVLAKDGL